MEEVFGVLENLDVISYAVGLVSAGVLFLLSKAPKKVKDFIASVIDKTDAELDKEKEENTPNVE